MTNTRPSFPAGPEPAPRGLEPDPAGRARGVGAPAAADGCRPMDPEAAPPMASTTKPAGIDRLALRRIRTRPETRPSPIAAGRAAGEVPFPAAEPARGPNPRPARDHTAPPCTREASSPHEPSPSATGDVMPSTQESLPVRLGQALRAAGLDRTQLARDAGVTAATVGRWLEGTEAPSADQLIAVAMALNVPPDRLAVGAGPMGAAGPPAADARPAWDFRPAPRDGGRDFGNPNVWAFDPGLDVLVREVLQNALDAASGPDGRVEVTFRVIRLAGADRRAFLRALAFDALRPRLEAAAAAGQKLGALLGDALGRLGGEDLLLLVVEDRGTVGLTGPERGHGHFAALTRNNLDSHKGATAGGAFGLGKAVLWRASRLGVVLFGSHLAEPTGGRSHGRLIGRCELAWHEFQGAEYSGPGWFGRPAADGAESIWGDDALAAALHVDREGAGTSLCVVGFHDPAADRDRPAEDLVDELAGAAARNFFPAMVAGRLAVSVELRDGRRTTREQDVAPAEYVPAFVRLLAAYRDGATVERPGEDGSVAARAVELAVPGRTADGPEAEQPAHRAVLLVAAAADGIGDEADGPEPPNQLVAFRGAGMAVQRLSLQGACLGGRPLHALLLCGTAPSLLAGDGPPSPAEVAAERFLKAAEPPSHDRWAATTGLKAAYAHGCLSRLKEFQAAAVDGVRALVRAPRADAGDGPRALRDLLRLGDGRPADDGLRVVEQAGAVDERGRWAIAARIRLRPARTATRLVPALYFVGEGGERVAAEWAELEPATAGCSAEGGGLRLPAGTREVRFRGITDPGSHPIPAAASCVAVGIRKFGPTGKEARP